MRLMVFITSVWIGLTVSSQPIAHISHYDEEDGLPHSHVTQLLQDELGFMWFATWNGLCRYDGYEFCTFKSQAGDGCHMPTDRFRDIALRPDGCIVCRSDDAYYLFNTRTCRFSDLTGEQARQAADDILRYRMSQAQKANNKVIAFTYTDHQGNLWATCTQGISKQTAKEQHTKRLDIEPKAEVKCLFVDSLQRYWVTTKEDATVRIYSNDGDRLLGYLGRDGRLHQQYTSFGSAIYCIYQSADGTLWLGSKPDGLFRLRTVSDSQFKIEHIRDLPGTSVYHLLEDHLGRLWVATLDGGICLTTEPQAENPRFTTPKNYPKDKGRRVRYLYLTKQGKILMAATTDGLIVSNLEQDANHMQFHQHQRESDRTASLSSSATMDIAENDDGLFVSTESSGVNRIDGQQLLANRLQFFHYTTQNHRLSDDVIMSLTRFDKNQLLIVGGHTISIVDSTGVKRTLDARHFTNDYRFSEAHPQRLSNNRWIFGLTDGAIIIATPQMFQQAYQPKVVLTGLSIQGGNNNRTVAYTDSLVLQPNERNITIHFAAIDYTASNRINYAFRLLPNEQWNYIGHNRSATLLDLKPGTYSLEIRSTDADGLWANNVRQLTIIVKPTFWESALGRLLLFMLIVGTLAIIAYTLLYIRRIKRQQHETLEAYLALLEENNREPIAKKAEPKIKTDDPILERVMAFIEQNIDNSDMNIGDMAAAAATSRSGLQRKLKQTMGITPQDLVREARIKHACQLLYKTDKTIAEVAYACGFTDPKYFSRCFKQSVGQSPTEYKNASLG